MKNVICENFNAQTLVYLRKSAGLTLNELGLKIDSSKDVISRWELGVKKPRVNGVQKLSEVFQIDASDFELSSHEFSQKHNLMHPAWTASLFNKVIMRIHKILDSEAHDVDDLIKQTLAATNAMNRIADKLDLLAQMQTTPSDAQNRLLETLSKLDKSDTEDFVEDPDADPRS